MGFTQSFVEFDDSDRERMSFVGDGVVAVLGDPALGQPVRGSRVHQPVVEAHADDGGTVTLNLLENLTKCSFV